MNNNLLVTTPSLPTGQYHFTVVAESPDGDDSNPSNTLVIVIVPVLNPPTISGVFDVTNDVSGEVTAGGDGVGTFNLLGETGSTGSNYLVEIFAQIGQAAQDTGASTVPAENGDFTIHGFGALIGTHILTAITIDPYGDRSDPSSPFTVVVQPPVPFALALQPRFVDITGTEITYDNPVTITGHCLSRFNSVLIHQRPNCLDQDMRTTPRAPSQ